MQQEAQSASAEDWTERNWQKQDIKGDDILLDMLSSIP